MLTSIVLESSALKVVSYDAGTEHLDVEFRDRAIYRYLGVPTALHAALLESPSKGSYFNREIRGRFRFVLVRGPGRISPKSDRQK